MKKIVLIGDIIASKKIRGRDKVQKKLNNLFQKINAGNKSLLSPYTITLGDEFQALYKNAFGLFKDIWQIMIILHPEKARFSFGVGEITTSINKKQAIGMDGPAFYSARQGLLQLKESGNLFNLSGDIKTADHLINESLIMISHIVYNWKETRKEIFNYLYDEIPVKEISKKMKISEQAVYKNIEAGALNIIVETAKKIEEIINKNLK
jgi:hypothetical protein